MNKEQFYEILGDIDDELISSSDDIAALVSIPESVIVTKEEEALSAVVMMSDAFSTKNRPEVNKKA